MAKGVTQFAAYQQQVYAELAAVPAEYLPYLLKMIQTFRASVELKPAEESFRQGWGEAQKGEVFPIEPEKVRQIIQDFDREEN
ncbi:MAG: hypothetical protein KIH69_008215 [Anaerolineae bacterium]|nr:hypothetical protein [Anaerolineae bacterium]